MLKRFALVEIEGSVWVTDTETPVHVCSLTPSLEATYLGELQGDVEMKSDVITTDSQTGEASYFSKNVLDSHTLTTFDMPADWVEINNEPLSDWTEYDNLSGDPNVRHQQALALMAFLSDGPADYDGPTFA